MLLPPQIADSPAIHLVGVDRPFTFENTKEISKLWDEFGPRLGSIPGQKNAYSYGVSHHFGESDFYYMAAAEVGEGVGAPEGMTTMDLPAQKYAMFRHQGGLAALTDSYMYIWDKWIPESGYHHVDRPLIIERYSENFDPDSATGEIELWLAIKS